MASLGIKLLGVLAALSSCLSLMGQQLCEGDLLFACSDSANAITAVTSGIEGLPIDHVGIVHRIGGNQGPLYVIEAVKPVVCLTPIDSFLCQNSMVIVGRVNVDMGTGRVTDYWKEFYSCRGMVVPEGKPGTNPGELSRRPEVTIIGNLVNGEIVSEEIKNPHLKSDN